MVGFILDIADRDAREEEWKILSTLVERSLDLVATADEEGKLAFINSAGRRLLGLHAEGDLNKINLAEQFHRAVRSERSSAPTPTGDKDVHTIEASCNSPEDGKQILLYGMTFPIPSASPSRNVQLWAYVAQDVTARTWSSRLELCQRLRENWTRRVYGTEQDVSG